MKKQPTIKSKNNPISRNTPETLRYFYHPDHIGSTSWVTDSAKNGIQYCEYLPYGEPFLEKRSTTWNSRYTFSGKERDNETGYSYFGARYYNSDISIWLSVDPLSDKYPNLSPYAYCANNPIILVDPDGKKIFIFGEDGSASIEYTQDMKYEGKDKLIAERVDVLNKMNKNENGKKVLTELVSSKNYYQLMSNDGSCGSNSFFSENNEKIGGGGGVIFLTNNSLSSISHEFFHAYQSEKGQGGGNSVLREVEAYLFSYSVANMTNDSQLYARDFQEGDGVSDYNLTITNLITSKKLDEQSLYDCVNGFKEFSKYGNSPSYKNLPLINRNQSTNPSNSLIKDFFPLK